MIKEHFKNTLIIFLCAFAVLSPCHVFAEQKQASVFWEISGNGLTKPSYLFGTLHMISQKDFFLKDGLEDKFKTYSKVVLEVDLDDPAFFYKAQQLMVMPDKRCYLR